MNFSDAETQILAMLHLAELQGAARDRTTLEALGQRYGTSKVDWADAFGSLETKGLITSTGDVFSLSGNGAEAAAACYAERPDRYFFHYREFYGRAQASAAHSKLCRRVYGMDLCQDGQVRIEELRKVLGDIGIGPGDRVLDLGCGAGGQTAFVAEETGADAAGLDISDSGIRVARARTIEGSGRLEFEQGDINNLPDTLGKFDVILCLDTLYWAADLARVIDDLATRLRPNGRLMIWASYESEQPVAPNIRGSVETDVSDALKTLNLTYERTDLTDTNLSFWQQMDRCVSDLTGEFVTEGNGWIAENLLLEAREKHLPVLRAGRLTRSLYQVRP